MYVVSDVVASLELKTSGTGAILWSEAPLVRGSFGPSFYENTRNLDPSAQRPFSSVKVAKFRRVFGPIL